MVRDANGNPVGSATVYLADAITGLVVAEVLSSESLVGLFEIHAVPLGTYTVHAEKGSLRSNTDMLFVTEDIMYNSEDLVLTEGLNWLLIGALVIGGVAATATVLYFITRKK